VGSASVHTTAAACDALAGRLSAADAVRVVGVLEPGVTERDLAEAVTVARTRLPAPTVDAETRSGDPSTALAAAIADADPDVVVLGARRGDPAAATDSPPGSTAGALWAGAERPVLVLPVAV
jgi:nucleotide-binding universal stress UspA family protein